MTVEQEEYIVPFFEDTRPTVRELLAEKKWRHMGFWLYRSPKNRFAPYVAIADLGYDRAMLLEGDLSVRHYTPKTTEVEYCGKKGQIAKTAASLFLEERGERVWETVCMENRRPSLEAQDALAEAASRAGATYRIFTEQQLDVRERGRIIRSRDTEIENWGVLVGAMTRGRPTRYVLNHESDTITRMLDENRKVTVADLLAEPNVDEGRMLAAIGLAVQKGLLRTDLVNRMFSQSSSISRGER